MRFSDRIGVTNQKMNIQLDSMSNELQNSLWNYLLELYDGQYGNYWHQITPHIAKYFRKYPVDELPIYDFQKRKWLKDYFFNLQWYDVYNLIEFIVKEHDDSCRTISSSYRENTHPIRSQKLESIFNSILERELSGFRFIGHTLSPITEQVELDEVQKAVQELRGKGLEGARKHIQTSLDLFSKRPNPDYRNAIKEAISAIESIAKQLGTTKGAGLAPALRALEEKARLHGSLRSAFEKLYGYSSDESGIRHAILDETEVGFEVAKYMIVSCSAFANYLATKAAKAGLL